jgi:hypothetical protein
MIYSDSSSSQQLSHLEWLLNGMVFMNGTLGETSLLLLIRPVTLSHAGQWECRAVFTDDTTSSSVSAGTLTVYSEYREIKIYSSRIQIKGILQWYPRQTPMYHNISRDHLLDYCLLIVMPISWCKRPTWAKVTS